MINELSILLPTYNNVCVTLVKTLQEQAMAIDGLHFEIIVADDGSTDTSAVGTNQIISQLENCRYIVRSENVGRAAIRNFLASQAIYDSLLFVDSDLHVDNPLFLYNYVNFSNGEVVVGGLKIGGNPKEWGSNLRYKYEKACEGEHDYQHRTDKGDKEFRTTNFLISKRVLAVCPFDENFRFYGYEDVLLGKTIAAKGYKISHIDNPILLDDFDTNAEFLHKTEEACRTLHQFRHQLKGYARLLCYADRLRKFHLYPLCHMLFRVFHKPMRSILIGNRPSMFLFNLYKLLYYIQLSLK